MQKKRLLILVGLLKETNYNAKISDIEIKIPSIGGLDTTSSLTAVENKMPDLNSLVKKSDYNKKISEIEKKLVIIMIINTLLLQSLII